MLNFVELWSGAKISLPDYSANFSGREKSQRYSLHYDGPLHEI